MSLAETLTRLRIFPLPAVQLFPHAVLPLFVFEPRYQELIKDCLEGDRMIALATLEPGFEGDYQGRPPVKRVCGVGLIIGHEPLADGRSNILVRGITRAEILSERAPDRAYRVVEARSLDDHWAEDLDVESAVQTLLLLSDRLARRLPNGGETLRKLARSQTGLGALVDILAAAIIIDPEERQALLENTDVGARVDVVSSTLLAISRGIAGDSTQN